MGQGSKVVLSLEEFSIICTAFLKRLARVYSKLKFLESRYSNEKLVELQMFF